MKIEDKEITIDLSKITIVEWRSLFRNTDNDDETDATIAKVTGLTVKDIRALKYVSFRRLLTAIISKAQEPLPDDDEKN